jgi:hypothetical protein
MPSTRLGVGLDRVDRAFRLADPAIDAFVRVDHEHVLALVEAVHGAHVDAVHGFAANAALVDDVGQLSVLSFWVTLLLVAGGPVHHMIARHEPNQSIRDTHIPGCPYGPDADDERRVGQFAVSGERGRLPEGSAAFSLRALQNVSRRAG